MTFILQRYGTSAAWTSADPVLLPGEVGWESDTSRCKVGNGFNKWTELSYVAGAVQTVNGMTGDVVLGKGSIGLGNVDNTADADKPVSTAQQAALDLKANRASPILTGTPTTPLASPGTNNNQIASTAFATALVNTAVATKAPIASPTFTGTPAAPTAAAGTSTTQIATTAFVQAAIATGTWVTVGSGGSAPAYGAGMSDANSGADYRCRFVRSGNMVTVVVAVTKGATSTLIFTLPVGYRPAATGLPVALVNGSGTPAANQGFMIFDTGVVGFLTSGLTNTTYYGMVTFPAAP